MSQGKVYTVCPHDCPSVCALEVERLDDNRIGKVKGSKDLSYTAGVVCGKVARYRERVHHPERLLHPLQRVGPKGSGQFQRITWEQALDRVAQAFLQAEDKYGAQSVWPYFYAGTMGLVMRDGINRLRHAKGYSKMAGTICVGLAHPGWLVGTGAMRGVDAMEMAQSEVIVIWGTNAVSTQVHVMTHALKAVKNGAKLIVVDPYHNKTAQRADLHLPIRPGTDAALACAVMHILFRDGYADRDYLQRYTDYPRELERHLRTKTPQWAARITGLAEASIESFAHLYGSTKKSFLRLGYGMSRSRNGATNVHAASCLPAVTGAWSVEGGGAMFSQSGLAKLDCTLINGLDADTASVRTLDMSRIGDILTGDEDALCGGGPVKAMLIQNTNPITVAPDTGKVREGFQREDLFVCVHEQFMTETAQLADIVLPATMFLEHDDIYKASGHCALQVTKKVINAPGECRSNHEVIIELARRLGARHRGFEMSAWEIIDQTLRSSGYPSAAEVHRNKGLDLTPSFEEAHFLNGFAHGDGKFHFKADWNALGKPGDGMPDFPDHWAVIDEVNAARPYRLVTAPAQNYLNSSFNETPFSQAQEQQPKALIHAQVVEKLGLTQGEVVSIGNDRGVVQLVVEVAHNQHPDTIVVEGLWPNAAFIGGRGINTLTSAEPGYPAGGAAFHDTSVWLRKG